MSKRLNLKDIDLKDKKFVFPLVIVVIVLFIGWFVFGAVKEMNASSSSEKEKGSEQEVSEIQSVPVETDKELLSKSEAMNEEYHQQQDFTAVQSGLQDRTLIETDTTLYTEEELNYIDSLEKITRQSQADIDAMNEQIKSQNESLQEERKALGETGLSLSSGDSRNNEELMNELIMYQKLMNGEEILTPEQEAQRKEEMIRQQERQKLMEELSSKETLKVEKALTLNSKAFNTVSSSSSSDLEQNTIKAMVDQTIKVETGSRVRFVLLEDVRLGGTIVRKGTYLFGEVSGFRGQRILTSVNSVLVNGKQLKVKLTALDVDGIEGFYVPRSIFRSLATEAASQAVQGQQVTVNTSNESVAGMAMQAVQNAYQSVASAISGNLRKQKATIKYNTIVYLLNEQ